MNRQDKDALKQALDQSARDLDAQTLSRLHQARNRAVEAAARPRFWQRIPLVPAAALSTAGAGALALMLWVNTPVPPTFDIETDPTALEMLATGESLELYDDLEFLMWLSEQDLDVG